MTPIDLEDLFDGALERRAPLLQSLVGDQIALRLLQGDADGLDGVTVDRYGQVLLVEEHLRETDAERLVEHLVERYGQAQQIVLKRRWSRDERGLAQQLQGAPLADEQLIEEDGLRFAVNLCRGEHTGLFLDARAARRRVREIASGCRVLNLFSYTGAFGVAAAAGGARSTTNVDNKKSALVIARKNYQLNDVEIDSRTFMSSDALQFLAKARKGRGRYDLVIVDPPPRFVKKGGRLVRLSESTGKIVARCVELLDSGVGGCGKLLVGTSTGRGKEDRLEEHIARASDLSGRQIRQLDVIDADIDFPPATGRPTSRFILVEVC